MNRTNFSHHGRVENNCHTFHCIQYTVNNFPSLRTRWIGEIFREQLICKSANENVRVMSYTLMSNHYHIASFYADHAARISFHRTFGRDFCKSVRKELKGLPESYWPKDTKGDPYLPQSIFKRRTYFEPLYSIEQIYLTLYKIFYNPQKWIEMGRYKGETGSKFYNSSSYDIEHNNQEIIEFDFVCAVLGLEDIKMLNSLFEKPEVEVLAFIRARLTNWKRKDDEKLLKVNFNEPWSSQSSKESKIDQNVNKYGPNKLSSS